MKPSVANALLAIVVVAIGIAIARRLPGRHPADARLVRARREDRAAQAAPIAFGTARCLVVR
jgi:hypothetical protein